MQSLYRPGSDSRILHQIPLCKKEILHHIKMSVNAWSTKYRWNHKLIAQFCCTLRDEILSLINQFLDNFLHKKQKCYRVREWQCVNSAAPNQVTKRGHSLMSEQCSWGACNNQQADNRCNCGSVMCRCTEAYFVSHPISWIGSNNMQRTQLLSLSPSCASVHTKPRPVSDAWAVFSSKKKYYAKKRLSVTLNLWYMHGVLNADEIKN
jgi:hypothetical protein